MYRQITNNDVQEQARPEIFGNLILYSVQPALAPGNTSSDVYIYDLSTNENRALATTNSSEYGVDISGSRVIIYDQGANVLKLINTNGTPINVNLPVGSGINSAIDSNNIAFADTRTNNVIGVYNIQSQSNSSYTIASTVVKTDFDISGSNIVYKEVNNIWTINTSGNNRRKLTSNRAINVSAPQISGDNVVFRETSISNDLVQSVQVYNLTTNNTINIQIPNNGSVLSEPDISGNLVVSFGTNANEERILYGSYADGTNLTALTTPGQVRLANAVSLSGNNAVWSDADAGYNDYELFGLTVAIDPLFRFYNPASKGHFFTASAQERDTVLANPDWGYRYEGVGFKNSVTTGIDLNPVYRFYNPVSRGHFFTINAAEKDTVLANPDWGYRYEDVGFYAFGASSNQGTDIFRFYNAESKGHFFTASTQEKDTVLANPDWGYQYEGVAFRGYI